MSDRIIKQKNLVKKLQPYSFSMKQSYREFFFYTFPIICFIGLRILAFPCNQFNGQEPGTPEDICSFADRQKVKFDLFEKIDVNGENTHPLWKYLKKEQGGTLGSFIKWNFTKFIVDKDGKVVERHGPNVDPNKLETHLEKYFWVQTHDHTERAIVTTKYSICIIKTIHQVLVKNRVSR